MIYWPQDINGNRPGNDVYQDIYISLTSLKIKSGVIFIHVTVGEQQVFEL